MQAPLMPCPRRAARSVRPESGEDVEEVGEPVVVEVSQTLEVVG